ncbi:hypothetical protein EI77_04582 [Prosthecobacter fusiformis]|uniref:Uncharacterized protein n=1 Tax=Prosthecobacter fusiformis TaxID=48464 RepID=A0A4R7RII2_9BACT|nr:hypothetical protein EI77_04582 [Prosthecobacter fusiformis]
MRPFRGTRPNDGILIIPGHSTTPQQDLQMQILALELQVTKQKELIDSQTAYIARLEAEITRLKPPVSPEAPQP